MTEKKENTEFQRIRTADEAFNTRTVAFYNRKGGVGKSSLCFLTARYLARLGLKVLAVDLDPQRTRTGHFVRLEGLPENTGRDANAFTMIMEQHPIYETTVRVGENLDLVPGSYDLSEIQSHVSVYRIREALDEVHGAHDFVLLDNAPNWTALIQAALHASDLVIIPALPAIEDLEQAEWTLIRTAKVSKAVRKIALNQFSSRSGEQMRELLKHYDPIFHDYLVVASIPRSGLVRRYTGTGESINRTARMKSVCRSGMNSRCD